MKKHVKKFIQGLGIFSVSGFNSALFGGLLGFVAASPGGAMAATITATGPDSTSVQNAINSAADGDTVVVPAGSSSWSSGINISKGIRLLGAGVGQTTVTMPGAGPLISLSPNGKYAQISGFTFNDNNTADHYQGLVRVLGGNNWRICSNRFNIYYFAIQTYGADATYGLIDRNECYADGSRGTENFYSLNGDGSSWASGPSYGATNCVYIEHNRIGYANGAGNGVGDTYNGARYVFRYNAVTNTWMDNHGCDSGGYRSPHSMEIYGNTLVYNSGLFAGIIFRGGTGLVFSNTVIGTKPGTGILLQNFRYGGSGSWCAQSLGNCQPWGSMTGSNPYDGNTSGDGYPGLDQVGLTGPTTFLSGHSTQVHMPVYCWANTLGFNPGTDVPANIVAGRDYVTSAPPFAYTPLSDPHPLAGGVVVGSTNPGISLSASSLNFGALPVGSSSNLTLTVQNVRSGTLSGSATTTAPFSIVSGGTYILTSNQSQTITIRYAPTAQGSSSGTINFTGGGGASASASGSAWAVLKGLSWPSTAGLIAGFSSTNSGGVNYIYQDSEVSDPASGGVAIYGFQITSPGNYVVSANVNAPDANANSLFINIDAQPVSPMMIWDINPPTTGFTNVVVSWRGSNTDTNNQYSPKIFTLSAGAHQLIIAGREPNCLLGPISISPPDVAQLPPPPTNLRVVTSP